MFLNLYLKLAQYHFVYQPMLLNNILDLILPNIQTSVSNIACNKPISNHLTVSADLVLPKAVPVFGYYFVKISGKDIMTFNLCFQNVNWFDYYYKVISR